MKKIFLILFLGLILLFQTSPAAASQTLDANFENEGGRYIWMSSNKIFSAWFDKDTIKFVRDDNGINTQVVDVWIKFTYSQQGVDEEIQFRTKHKLSVTGYENLHKTIYHYLFNLDTNSTKLLGNTAYDWNGNVIDNYYFSEDRVSWATAIPGGLGESWVKIIRYYSTNNSDVLKERS